MEDPTRHRWQRIEEIFDAVVDLSEPERSAALDEACAGDQELRREVEAYLEADDKPFSLFEHQAATVFSGFGLLAEGAQGAGAGGSEGLERPGSLLGAYRVVDEIGRGGMSVVLLGERADGRFKKRVAIKVLLPGGGHSSERIRRFRAERAILARLDHHDIAKVLDGGETAAGLPYVVMDYVEGKPLDKAADEAGLSVGGRLELLERVCAALDYAHQRLVVHRDLKPSNILVRLERPASATTGGDFAFTVEGWHAEVKLLDFGIAKLLAEEPDDEFTEDTRTGFFAMTPEYAAPEQMSGGEITMATDVYALGVLLYELLTGRRPHSLRGRSFFEMARLVREGNVRPPSELVEKGEGPLPRSAAATLRGDLDAIVMKALEPDAGRRYSSARALFEELQRWRAGLPVQARAPTLGYVATKFLRRHRVGVGAVALFFALTVVFTSALLISQRETARERDRAEAEAQRAEAVSRFMIELIHGADSRQARGRERRVSDLIDDARGRLETELSEAPLVKARVLRVLANVYSSLGDDAAATPLYEQEVELLRSSPEAEPAQLSMALLHLALNQTTLGRHERGLKLAREGRALQEQVLAADDERHVFGLTRLADALRRKGELEEAKRVGEQAVAEARRLLGPDHAKTAAALTTLGKALRDLGLSAEAKELVVEALAIHKRVDGDEHLSTIGTLAELASLEARLGNLEEAEALMKEAFETRRRVQGDDAPALIGAQGNLIAVRMMKGELEAVEPLWGELTQRIVAAWGREHPALFTALHNHGETLRRVGRLDEARPRYREALEVGALVYGEDNPRLADTLASLGAVELELGVPGSARAHLERALALHLQLLDEDDEKVVELRELLAKIGD